MSFDDLFEAIKAFILPLLTRFERLESRLTEIEGAADEGSEAYTQVSILEERLSEVNLDLISRVDFHDFIDYEPAEIEGSIERLDQGLEGIKGDIRRLDNEMGELNGSLLTIRSEEFVSSEHAALKEDFEELKAAHQAQAEIISKLLKALEWEPPKD